MELSIFAASLMVTLTLNEKKELNSPILWTLKGEGGREGGKERGRERRRGMGFLYRYEGSFNIQAASVVSGVLDSALLCAAEMWTMLSKCVDQSYDSAVKSDAAVPKS